MAKKTKAQLAEKEESRVALAALLNPNGLHREVNAAGDLRWFGADGISIGDYDVRKYLPTIYIVIDTVARSGMSRTMRVYVQAEDDDGRPYLQWITGHVARVLGWRLERGGRDAVRVDGCGMDMCFHLVDCLLHAVFGYGPEALNANHYRRETL